MGFENLCLMGLIEVNTRRVLEEIENRTTYLDSVCNCITATACKLTFLLRFAEMKYTLDRTL